MVQELNFQAYSDRLPPQNIDAEEAILGGILLDPEAIGRVADGDSPLRISSLAVNQGEPGSGNARAAH